MASLVPEAGLSLWRGDQPGNLSPDPHAKQTQIMRLNLTQSTLDELVESLRNDQKARLRLGKHQTLYYGSKSHQFHSHLEPHRSELYKTSPTDKENLYFSGVLSHSLEVQKAKEATAATDEALANLEQSLSAFERGKESKKTQLVNLKPGDQRSRSKVPLSKIDLDKERFFKNRSISGSPSLGAIRSPASSLPALTPTSVPSSQNKRKIRLEALKTPFIHLLAVTPVSVKYLAQTTRSSQEDCLELARKYGVENRIDPSKFNLKDKCYKELDIWNFPYPSESDRTSAIENAISAFDRQRISPSDKLWQMLNSKEERAKGVCKSRLKLQTGPPPIKVHASEETSKEGYMTGNETDRTNGRLTPNGDSTTSKPAPKKMATTKSKNTTLTGRVTKKTEKKAPAKPTGKFKSAEFVHDSDEDTDIPDAPPVRPPPPAAKKAPAASSTEAKKAPAKPVADNKPAKAASKPSSVTHSPTVKPQITLKPQPRTIKTIPASSANGTGSKTLPGSRATKPTSPVKKSPLASSPPTNASDIDNSSQNSGQTSSSSSSPLMAQMAKQNKAKYTVTTTATKPRAPAAKPNGTVKPAVEQANPLKRKALPEPMPTGRINRNGDDIKRRRPIESMSPSGTSSGSASPPLNREHLRQQLRQKSMEFKKLYSKYRALHDSLVNQLNPMPSDLTRLKQMHARVQRTKKEIWDEDRRLRR
ncbi:conserved hypothetical protein [Talaromyces stipitatus ATCC 10500]|uniref:Uncharacterized protein n=1 Tax=Talaromyces stipitatus (strain ATCC 10500 / CBS 375.48 / QM 6759 / NRRL 1006) TaxID=441959 RepID=B8LXI5_TALSN|nr:uncharacterized protein TSTA_078450 [Talaromyces stipitatus ATCC 10500]EED24486.1 conserved hypothetical protein [Talaromyces stipitatus ATCC 10500]